MAWVGEITSAENELAAMRGSSAAAQQTDGINGKSRHLLELRSMVQATAQRETALALVGAPPDQWQHRAAETLVRLNIPQIPESVRPFILAGVQEALDAAPAGERSVKPPTLTVTAADPRTGALAGIAESARQGSADAPLSTETRLARAGAGALIWEWQAAQDSGVADALEQQARAYEQLDPGSDRAVQARLRADAAVARALADGGQSALYRAEANELLLSPGGRAALPGAKRTLDGGLAPLGRPWSPASPEGTLEQARIRRSQIAGQAGLLNEAWSHAVAASRAASSTEAKQAEVAQLEGAHGRLLISAPVLPDPAGDDDLKGRFEVELQSYEQAVVGTRGRLAVAKAELETLAATVGAERAFARERLAEFGQAAGTMPSPTGPAAEAPEDAQAEAISARTALQAAQAQRELAAAQEGLARIEAEAGQFRIDRLQERLWEEGEISLVRERRMRLLSDTGLADWGNRADKPLVERLDAPELEDIYPYTSLEWDELSARRADANERLLHARKSSLEIAQQVNTETRATARQRIAELRGRGVVTVAADVDAPAPGLSGASVEEAEEALAQLTAEGEEIAGQLEFVNFTLGQPPEARADPAKMAAVEYRFVMEDPKRLQPSFNAFARTMEQLPRNADGTVTLTVGPQLENVLGAALGLRPNRPVQASAGAVDDALYPGAPGEGLASAAGSLGTAREGDGEDWYSGRSQQQLTPVIDELLGVTGAGPGKTINVKIHPVVMAFPTGIRSTVLIEARGSGGETWFIDDEGGKNTSVDDLRTQLPAGGKLFLPKGLSLARIGGDVQIEEMDSHLTTGGEVFRAVGDYASVGLSLLGTGLTMTGAGALIGAPMLVAAGSWGIYSTVDYTADRIRHGRLTGWDVFSGALGLGASAVPLGAGLVRIGASGAGRLGSALTGAAQFEGLHGMAGLGRAYTGLSGALGRAAAALERSGLFVGAPLVADQMWNLAIHSGEMSTRDLLLGVLGLGDMAFGMSAHQLRAKFEARAEATDPLGVGGFDFGSGGFGERDYQGSAPSTRLMKLYEAGLDGVYRDSHKLLSHEAGRIVVDGEVADVRVAAEEPAAGPETPHTDRWTEPRPQAAHREVAVGENLVPASSRLAPIAALGPEGRGERAIGPAASSDAPSVTTPRPDLVQPPQQRPPGEEPGRIAAAGPASRHTDASGRVLSRDGGSRPGAPSGRDARSRPETGPVTARTDAAGPGRGTIGPRRDPASGPVAPAGAAPKPRDDARRGAGGPVADPAVRPGGAGDQAWHGSVSGLFGGVERSNDRQLGSAGRPPAGTPAGDKVPPVDPLGQSPGRGLSPPGDDRAPGMPRATDGPDAGPPATPRGGDGDQSPDGPGRSGPDDVRSPAQDPTAGGLRPAVNPAQPGSAPAPGATAPVDPTRVNPVTRDHGSAQQGGPQQDGARPSPADQGGIQKLPPSAVTGHGGGRTSASDPGAGEATVPGQLVEPVDRDGTGGGRGRREDQDGESRPGGSVPPTRAEAATAEGFDPAELLNVYEYIRRNFGEEVWEADARILPWLGERMGGRLARLRQSSDDGDWVGADLGSGPVPLGGLVLQRLGASRVDMLEYAAAARQYLHDLFAIPDLSNHEIWGKYEPYTGGNLASLKPGIGFVDLFSPAERLRDRHKVITALTVLESITPNEAAFHQVTLNALDTLEAGGIAGFTFMAGSHSWTDGAGHLFPAAGVSRERIEAFVRLIDPDADPDADFYFVERDPDDGHSEYEGFLAAVLQKPVNYSRASIEERLQGWYEEPALESAVEGASQDERAASSHRPDPAIGNEAARPVRWDEDGVSGSDSDPGPSAASKLPSGSTSGPSDTIHGGAGEPSAAVEQAGAGALSVSQTSENADGTERVLPRGSQGGGLRREVRADPASRSRPGADQARPVAARDDSRGPGRTSLGSRHRPEPESGVPAMVTLKPRSTGEGAERPAADITIRLGTYLEGPDGVRAVPEAPSARIGDSVSPGHPIVDPLERRTAEGPAMADEDSSSRQGPTGSESRAHRGSDPDVVPESLVPRPGSGERQNGGNPGREPSVDAVTGRPGDGRSEAAYHASASEPLPVEPAEADGLPRVARKLTPAELAQNLEAALAILGRIARDLPPMPEMPMSVLADQCSRSPTLMELIRVADRRRIRIFSSTQGNWYDHLTNKIHVSPRILGFLLRRESVDAEMFATEMIRFLTHELAHAYYSNSVSRREILDSQEPLGIFGGIEALGTVPRPEDFDSSEMFMVKRVSASLTEEGFCRLTEYLVEGERIHNGGTPGSRNERHGADRAVFARYLARQLDLPQACQAMGDLFRTKQWPAGGITYEKHYANIAKEIWFISRRGYPKEVSPINSADDPNPTLQDDSGEEIIDGDRGGALVTDREAATPPARAGDLPPKDPPSNDGPPAPADSPDPDEVRRLAEVRSLIGDARALMDEMGGLDEDRAALDTLSRYLDTYGVVDPHGVEQLRFHLSRLVGGYEEYRRGATDHLRDRSVYTLSTREQSLQDITSLAFAAQTILLDGRTVASAGLEPGNGPPLVYGRAEERQPFLINGDAQKGPQAPLVLPPDLVESGVLPVALGGQRAFAQGIDGGLVSEAQLARAIADAPLRRPDGSETSLGRLAQEGGPLPKILLLVDEAGVPGGYAKPLADALASRLGRDDIAVLAPDGLVDPILDGPLELDSGEVVQPGQLTVLRRDGSAGGLIEHRPGPAAQRVPSLQIRMPDLSWGGQTVSAVPVGVYAVSAQVFGGKVFADPYRPESRGQGYTPAEFAAYLLGGDYRPGQPVMLLSSYGNQVAGALAEALNAPVIATYGSLANGVGLARESSKVVDDSRRPAGWIIADALNTSFAQLAWEPQPEAVPGDSSDDDEDGSDSDEEIRGGVSPLPGPVDMGASGGGAAEARTDASAGRMAFPVDVMSELTPGTKVLGIGQSLDDFGRMLRRDGVDYSDLRLDGKGNPLSSGQFDHIFVDLSSFDGRGKNKGRNKKTFKTLLSRIKVVLRSGGKMHLVGVPNSKVLQIVLENIPDLELTRNEKAPHQAYWRITKTAPAEASSRGVARPPEPAVTEPSGWSAEAPAEVGADGDATVARGAGATEPAIEAGFGGRLSIGPNGEKVGSDSAELNVAGQNSEDGRPPAKTSDGPSLPPPPPPRPVAGDWPDPEDGERPGAELPPDQTAGSEVESDVVSAGPVLGVNEDALLAALKKRVDPEFRGRLVEYVKKRQRITFRDYMEFCLQGLDGRGGYYNSGMVDISIQAGEAGSTIGLDSVGDFATAPERSKDLGGAIANALDRMHEAMGRPSDFEIVEMGAGNGTLAQAILVTARHRHPELYSSVRYTIVERSEGLIRRQKKILEGEAVDWIHTSAVEIPRHDVIGVFLSNELVDAFPVHRVVRRGGDIREIYVTLDKEERFVEVEGDLSPELVARVAELDILLPSRSALADGQEMAVPLDATKWMRSVDNALGRGYVLTIDYGAPGYHRPFAFYKKELPISAAYEAPGAVDITYLVDFAALQSVGRKGRLRPSTLPNLPGLQLQRRFLIESGFSGAAQPGGALSGHRLFWVQIQEKVPSAEVLPRGVSDSRGGSVKALGQPEGRDEGGRPEDNEGPPDDPPDGDGGGVSPSTTPPATVPPGGGGRVLNDDEIASLDPSAPSTQTGIVPPRDPPPADGDGLDPDDDGTGPGGDAPGDPAVGRQILGVEPHFSGSEVREGATEPLAGGDRPDLDRQASIHSSTESQGAVPAAIEPTNAASSSFSPRDDSGGSGDGGKPQLEAAAADSLATGDGSRLDEDGGDTPEDPAGGGLPPSSPRFGAAGGGGNPAAPRQPGELLSIVSTGTSDEGSGGRAGQGLEVVPEEVPEPDAEEVGGTDPSVIAQTGRSTSRPIPTEADILPLLHDHRDSLTPLCFELREHLEFVRETQRDELGVTYDQVMPHAVVRAPMRPFVDEEINPWDLMARGLSQRDRLAFFDSVLTSRDLGNDQAVSRIAFSDAEEIFVDLADRDVLLLPSGTVQIPFGAYGEQFSYDLVRATGILARIAKHKSEQSTLRLTNSRSDLFESTIAGHFRNRDDFHSDYNSALAVLQEGIIGLADGVWMATADAINAPRDPLEALRALVENRIPQQIALRFGSGVLAPSRSSGRFIRNLVIWRDGVPILNPQLMPAIHDQKREMAKAEREGAVEEGRPEPAFGRGCPVAHPVRDQDNDGSSSSGVQALSEALLRIMSDLAERREAGGLDPVPEVPGPHNRAQLDLRVIPSDTTLPELVRDRDAFDFALGWTRQKVDPTFNPLEDLPGEEIGEIEGGALIAQQAQILLFTKYWKTSKNHQAPQKEVSKYQSRILGAVADWNGSRLEQQHEASFADASGARAVAEEVGSQERSQVEDLGDDGDRARRHIMSLEGRGTNRAGITEGEETARGGLTPEADELKASVGELHVKIMPPPNGELAAAVEYPDPQDVWLYGFVSKASALGVSRGTASALAGGRPLLGPPMDAVTGYYDGRTGLREAELERAQAYVGETGQPSFYVSGDIANLGGLNQAMRNRAEVANVHFRALTDILRGTLAEAGAALVPMRTGGDEVGLVVVGIDKEVLSAALGLVEDRIQTYVRAADLAGIPHPKHPGEKGVGLHLGLAEILPGISRASIFNTADLGVDRSKARNVAGEQGHAIGADGADPGAARATNSGAGTAVRARADESAGRAGVSEGEGTGGRNLSSEASDLRASVDELVARIMPPSSEVVAAVEYQAPSEVWLHGFVRKATTLGVPEETALALVAGPPLLGPPVNAVTGYYDGTTGLKEAEVERAQSYVDGTGRPAFYVSGDIANLGGLNQAMGNRAERANVHFRALTDILRGTLAETGAALVPMRTGGDEVGIVVLGADEEALSAALDLAGDRIQAYVRDAGLADVPHPKHPDERGIGLHLGSAEILPGISPESIFNTADLGVDRSKTAQSSREDNRVAEPSLRESEASGQGGDEPGEEGEADGGRVSPSPEPRDTGPSSGAKAVPGDVPEADLPAEASAAAKSAATDEADAIQSPEAEQALRKANDLIEELQPERNGLDRDAIGAVLARLAEIGANARSLPPAVTEALSAVRRLAGNRWLTTLQALRTMEKHGADARLQGEWLREAVIHPLAEAMRSARATVEAGDGAEIVGPSILAAGEARRTPGRRALDSLVAKARVVEDLREAAALLPGDLPALYPFYPGTTLPGPPEGERPIEPRRIGILPGRQRWKDFLAENEGNEAAQRAVEDEVGDFLERAALPLRAADLDDVNEGPARVELPPDVAGARAKAETGYREFMARTGDQAPRMSSGKLLTTLDTLGEKLQAAARGVKNVLGGSVEPVGLADMLRNGPEKISYEAVLAAIRTEIGWTIERLDRLAGGPVGRPDRLVQGEALLRDLDDELEATHGYVQARDDGGRTPPAGGLAAADLARVRVEVGAVRRQLADLFGRGWSELAGYQVEWAFRRLSRTLRDVQPRKLRKPRIHIPRELERLFPETQAYLQFKRAMALWGDRIPRVGTFEDRSPDRTSDRGDGRSNDPAADGSSFARRTEGEDRRIASALETHYEIWATIRILGRTNAASPGRLDGPSISQKIIAARNLASSLQPDQLRGVPPEYQEQSWRDLKGALNECVAWLEEAILWLGAKTEYRVREGDPDYRGIPNEIRRNPSIEAALRHMDEGRRFTRQALSTNEPDGVELLADNTLAHLREAITSLETYCKASLGYEPPTAGEEPAVRELEDRLVRQIEAHPDPASGAAGEGNRRTNDLSAGYHDSRPPYAVETEFGNSVPPSGELRSEMEAALARLGMNVDPANSPDGEGAVPAAPRLGDVFRRDASGQWHWQTPSEEAPAAGVRKPLDYLVAVDGTRRSPEDKIVSAVERQAMRFDGPALYLQGVGTEGWAPLFGAATGLGSESRARAVVQSVIDLVGAGYKIRLHGVGYSRGAASLLKAYQDLAGVSDVDLVSLALYDTVPGNVLGLGIQEDTLAVPPEVGLAVHFKALFDDRVFFGGPSIEPRADHPGSDRNRIELAFPARHGGVGGDWSDMPDLSLSMMTAWMHAAGAPVEPYRLDPSELSGMNLEIQRLNRPIVDTPRREGSREIWYPDDPAWPRGYRLPQGDRVRGLTPETADSYIDWIPGNWGPGNWTLDNKPLPVGRINDPKGLVERMASLGYWPDGGPDGMPAAREGQIHPRSSQEPEEFGTRVSSAVSGGEVRAAGPQLAREMVVAGRTMAGMPADQLDMLAAAREETGTTERVATRSGGHPQSRPADRIPVGRGNIALYGEADAQALMDALRDGRLAADGDIYIYKFYNRWLAPDTSAPATLRTAQLRDWALVPKEGGGDALVSGRFRAGERWFVGAPEMSGQPVFVVSRDLPAQVEAAGGFTGVDWAPRPDFEFVRQTPLQEPEQGAASLEPAIQAKPVGEVHARTADSTFDPLRHRIADDLRRAANQGGEPRGTPSLPPLDLGGAVPLPPHLQAQADAMMSKPVQEGTHHLSAGYRHSNEPSGPQGGNASRPAVPAAAASDPPAGPPAAEPTRRWWRRWKKPDIRLSGLLRVRANTGPVTGAGSPTLRGYGFGVGTNTDLRAVRRAFARSGRDGVAEISKQFIFTKRTQEHQNVTAMQAGGSFVSHQSIFVLQGGHLLKILERAAFEDGGDPVFDVRPSFGEIVGPAEGGSGTVVRVVGSLVPRGEPVQLAEGETGFFPTPADKPVESVRLPGPLRFDKVMEETKLTLRVPVLGHIPLLRRILTGLPRWGVERRPEVKHAVSLPEGAVVPKPFVDGVAARTGRAELAFEVVIANPAAARRLAEAPSVEALRALVKAGELDPEKAEFYVPGAASGLRLSAVAGNQALIPVTDLSGKPRFRWNPKFSFLDIFFNDPIPTRGRSVPNPDRLVNMALAPVKSRWSRAWNRLMPETAPKGRVARWLWRRRGQLDPQQPRALPTTGPVFRAFFGPRMEFAARETRYTFSWGSEYWRVPRLVAVSLEGRLQAKKPAPEEAPVLAERRWARAEFLHPAGLETELAIPGWLAKAMIWANQGNPLILPKGSRAAMEEFIADLETDATPLQRQAIDEFRADLLLEFKDQDFFPRDRTGEIAIFLEGQGSPSGPLPPADMTHLAAKGAELDRWYAEHGIEEEPGRDQPLMPLWDAERRRPPDGPDPAGGGAPFPPQPPVPPTPSGGGREAAALSIPPDPPSSAAEPKLASSGEEGGGPSAASDEGAPAGAVRQTDAPSVPMRGGFRSAGNKTAPEAPKSTPALPEVEDKGARGRPPEANVKKAAVAIVAARVATAAFGHATGQMWAFEAISGRGASTLAYWRSAVSKYAWLQNNHAMIDVFDLAARGKTRKALGLAERILDRAPRRGAARLNEQEAGELLAEVEAIGKAAEGYRAEREALALHLRKLLPDITIRDFPPPEEVLRNWLPTDLGLHPDVGRLLEEMGQDTGPFPGQRPQEILGRLLSHLDALALDDLRGGQHRAKGPEGEAPQPDRPLQSHLIDTHEARQAYRVLHQMVREALPSGETGAIRHKTAEGKVAGSMSPETWLGWFFKLASFGGAFNVLLAWLSKPMPKHGSWVDWGAYAADPVGVIPATYVQWKYLESLRQLTEFKTQFPYPRTSEQDAQLARLEKAKAHYNRLADLTSLASAARSLLAGSQHLSAGDHALASATFLQALSSVGWVLVQRTPSWLKIDPKTKAFVRYSAIALGILVPTLVLLIKTVFEDEKKEEKGPSVADLAFTGLDDLEEQVRQMMADLSPKTEPGPQASSPVTAPPQPSPGLTPASPPSSPVEPPASKPPEPLPVATVLPHGGERKDAGTLWDIAAAHLDVLLTPEQFALPISMNAKIARYGVPRLIELNPQYPLASSPNLIRPNWKLRVG
ncbi:SAM-dependent methyltransferase [Inquilinus sp. OTU3971]|uniref:SAM-dependent methyltransferase n=1 Tax=Inquilinus sp. OTU3971 TaxID=3043855 RepID=UPI00313F1760